MARRKQFRDELEVMDELIMEARSVEEKQELEEEKEWAEKKLKGETYRLTYLDLGQKEMGYMTLRDKDSYRPHESRLVHSGSWILVTNSPPVGSEYKPVDWGIYWGTPCSESINNDGFSKDGSYKIEILVRHKSINKIEVVGLFPHEYLVLSEKLFNGLMDTNGYNLQRIADEPIGSGLNLDLIEKGRSLTEDERSIIWSLQVDGLIESKACEEYFMGRHTDEENNHIWYMPTEECSDYLESQYGAFRYIGTGL